MTSFQSGNSYNIIPDEAKLTGCVRGFNPRVIDQIEGRMREIIARVAEAHDCAATFDYRKNYPVVFNTSEETQLCADVARTLAGEENVDDQVTPVMGSEDFAFMLQERPGCYIFLGSGGGLGNGGQGDCMCHHPAYDFNDEAIPIGATYWSRLAETLLPPG